MNFKLLYFKLNLKISINSLLVYIYFFDWCFFFRRYIGGKMSGIRIFFYLFNINYYFLLENGYL